MENRSARSVSMHVEKTKTLHFVGTAFAYGADSPRYFPSDIPRGRFESVESDLDMQSHMENVFEANILRSHTTLNPPLYNFGPEKHLLKEKSSSSGPMAGIKEISTNTNDIHEELRMTKREKTQLPLDTMPSKK